MPHRRCDGMQIKYGDVREAVSMAMGLLVSGRQLEVQHFGFQLLQTLVRSKPRISYVIILPVQ